MVLRNLSQGSSDRGDHPMQLFFPENYNYDSRRPFTVRHVAAVSIESVLMVLVRCSLEMKLNGLWFPMFVFPPFATLKDLLTNPHGDQVQINVEKTIERDLDGISSQTIMMHHVKGHSLESERDLDIPRARGPAAGRDI